MAQEANRQGNLSRTPVPNNSTEGQGQLFGGSTKPADDTPPIDSVAEAGQPDSRPSPAGSPTHGKPEDVIAILDTGKAEVDDKPKEHEKAAEVERPSTESDFGLWDDEEEKPETPEQEEEEEDPWA